MRAGIGLLSLLIVVAIVMFVMFSGPGGGYIPTVLDAGKKGQKESQQISGRTEDNVPIQDTIKLDEVDSNGQFKRLKVVSIVPKTPMETAYGLQAGDEITHVGEMNVADNNDAGLAKALVYEAYQNNRSIKFLRNDVETMVNPTTPLTTIRPDLFGKPSTVTNVPTH